MRVVSPVLHSRRGAAVVILAALLLAPVPGFAQEAQVELPESLEEAETIGKNVLQALPDAMLMVWKEEAMPILLKVKAVLWDGIAAPVVLKTWEGLAGVFEEEIEAREGVIEQELEKEKQELKQDAESLWGSLWERFKALLNPQKD